MTASVALPAAAPACLERRTGTELVLRQLHGIDAWTRDSPAQPAGPSREALMDWRRVMERRERERAAMTAHIERQDAAGPRPMVTAGPSTVLVVHRQPWFCEKVSAALQHEHFARPIVMHDGADRIGVLVAEQPDIMIVEDRLPSVSGIDIVVRAHVLAPRTAVVVQIATDQNAAAALDAGARAVFTRQVPLHQLAADVKTLLTEHFSRRRNLP